MDFERFASPNWLSTTLSASSRSRKPPTNFIDEAFFLDPSDGVGCLLMIVLSAVNTKKKATQIAPSGFDHCLTKGGCRPLRGRHPRLAPAPRAWISGDQ